MHILLFVPDNHVTRNFVPQLWPFLLRERTPAGHRVTIIDSNAQPTSADELVRFIREERVGLVGMGFMTRMAEKAYQVATVIRSETGVPVVFGGPHVTSVPDEALGRDQLPRCADSVVLGEADDVWPEVVEDAARGTLKDVYGPDGHGGKPTLEDYKANDWEHTDLSLFNLMRFVPDPIRRLLKRLDVPFQKLYVVPVETSRGCPYGCEFCTVTGFFGQQLRFRSNESVIAELKTLKEVAARDHALLSVFFIDDNFAIRRDRLKALLREMIEQDACLPWIAQISINLLDDEELVELIGASGGRFIFMGLESVNPESLKSVRKGFNRPEHYARTLERLAQQDVYAITSFIVGFDTDHPGMAETLGEQIALWPPVLPVFGLLTPYPATPLYQKLMAAGRMIRPQHWLGSTAFKSTYEPTHFTQASAEAEVRRAWTVAYTSARFKDTQRWLVAHDKDFTAQMMFLVSRLLFRGIYFRQSTAFDWVRLLAANSPTIARIIARRLFRSETTPDSGSTSVSVSTPSVPATPDSL
ncbi:MAG TPA: radical SAM protein [Vicinamibacterales bacterium]|jgi:radical SAM superfamily enzyme YgiQ (UPF0313 family)